jgi:hypothetical protein
MPFLTLSFAFLPVAPWSFMWRVVVMWWSVIAFISAVVHLVCLDFPFALRISRLIFSYRLRELAVASIAASGLAIAVAVERELTSVSLPVIGIFTIPVEVGFIAGLVASFAVEFVVAAAVGD